MFKVLSVLAIIAVSLASASKKCGQDVRNQMEQKVAQCQFKAERTFPTARPCAYIEGLIKCSEDFKDCYDEEETRHGGCSFIKSDCNFHKRIKCTIVEIGRKFEFRGKLHSQFCSFFNAHKNSPSSDGTKVQADFN